jgi:O-antigen ligase
LAIGASLIAMPMEMANPESASIPSLVSALHIVSGLGGIIFTILLAIRVYRPILGIPLGLLAAIPLFGILIMLIVNGRATGLLRKNGFKVGLMGANLDVESGSYRRMNDESRDEED